MRRKRCVPGHARLLVALASASPMVIPDQAWAYERTRTAVACSFVAASADLEQRVDDIANRIANAKPYFEDDHDPIHIRSRFDPVACSLEMAIDERFGPVSGLGEMEQMQSDITYAIWSLVEEIDGFQGLDWRYGGKDMYFWFPGDRRAPETKRQMSRGQTNGGSVLLNAGHGYYFHHGYGDWRLQREPANGVTEDEITGQMVMPLYGMLAVTGTGVTLARQATSPGDHVGSGKPLYLMAARYLLEMALPDRTDIWHSLPESTAPLREYYEDIRSRPLYANALGVDAMLSLHTNAAADPRAHGTTVIVQPGRPESAALGTLALCSIAEQVHAREEYKDFAVARVPLQLDKGENRLAAMPSIIVELAFHTNESDALALKDPIFVASSMKGLAKGYRLYREGKKCEDFEIDVPATATGLAGDVARIAVKLSGNPVFPVTASAREKNCLPGATCLDDIEVLPEDDGSREVVLGYRCPSEGPAISVFPVVVEAHDIDGIKVKSKEVIVSCIGATPSVQSPDTGPT